MALLLLSLRRRGDNSIIAWHCIIMATAKAAGWRDVNLLVSNKLYYDAYFAATSGKWLRFVECRHPNLNIMKIYYAHQAKPFIKQHWAVSWICDLKTLAASRTGGCAPNFRVLLKKVDRFIFTIRSSKPYPPKRKLLAPSTLLQAFKQASA